MARKKIPPETKARAVEQVRKYGRTLLDVAREVGVQEGTVSRWCTESRLSPIVERAAALAARVESPPDPAEESDTDLSTLDQVRALQKRMQALAATAEASGNATAAQRALRDAAALANTIARLERTQIEMGDDVRIPRDEVEARKAELLARVHTMLERPLLCADCGRALSVEIGTEGKSE